MYARLSRLRIKDAYNSEETRGRLRALLPTRLKALPGLLDTYILGLEPDGAVAVFSVYESREALLRANAESEGLWLECAHMIEGEVEQQELPVFMHTHCAP